MTNYDKEEIAFELLQCIPYCLPAEYDDDLATVGHYSRTQKQRSDQAIDEWDKQHPYESSDELKAFKELERLGVYSQFDFYSPTKAKDGHYTRRLKQHRDDSRQPQRPSGSTQPIRSTRKHRPL